MSDLTTEILRDIRDGVREVRDEVREVRDGLRGTNERLDQTNERLDRTNERLDRVVQEQIRQSTAIVALEGTVRGLNSRIDNVLVGGMGQTVREHESRLHRVEAHLGLGPFGK